MKTLTPKPCDIKRGWYLIDASEQTLGRLSTKVAHILKGKNKTYYVPHLDCGDFVIIINADKVVLTGSKELQKEYQSYSGYPGGLKRIPYKRMLSERPENVIFKAVKGMLPKNSLGRQMIKKLKIYIEDTHPHSAQKPEMLSV
ncbi:MAG: 50S ribosomal protein L13 [Candidatus Cloacimonetes bacterium]|nr:50S ribosomal protein L13 [Candidatus Cloacimonadota bacterium]